MMIERFRAKGFELQFVDQILGRIGELPLVIPDKLGQRGLRPESRCWRKVKGEIEMYTTNLCHLLAGDSRQFW